MLPNRRRTCYPVPMAQVCPACSRRNGDRATKCLYCSEALEPVEAPETATPDDVSPVPTDPSGTEDSQLVIFFPGEGRTEATVSRLAEIAGLSRYEARLWLQASRPRLFRRIETEPLARELSERMTEASVPHFLAPEARVRSTAIARARQAVFGERHFDIVIDDRTTTVLYEELLLLVRGEITRANHDDKRLGTAKSVTRKLTPGILLHLYLRNQNLAVEIDPESFGWPDHGDRVSPSSLVNLERFVGVLREKAPHAAVDRAFDLEPAVLSRSGSDSELTHMLSDGGLGARGVVYDNGEQFRFYSRWRYQLERHLSMRDETPA